MVLAELQASLQFIATIVGLIGGLAGLISLYVTLSKEFLPKLEINVHIPQSSKHIIPIVDGIIPQNFDEEKIANWIKTPDVPEGFLKTIQVIIKTLSEIFLNDPKKAIMTIVINNVGKRTVYLCTFGIKVYTDSYGLVKLQEWEMGTILEPNKTYSRKITTGEFLILLKPYLSDEEIKLVVYFKDNNEKHKPYEKNFIFKAWEWEDLIESYNEEMKKIEDINKGIDALDKKIATLFPKPQIDQTKKL